MRLKEEISRSLAAPQAPQEGRLGYVGVRDFLDDQIRTGKLRAGEALPEERDLALRFGLSRVTIRKALKELADRRLVRRVRGKGTYVMGQMERVRTEFVGVSMLSMLHQARVYDGVYEVLRQHNRFAVTATYRYDELAEEALLLRQMIEQGIGGLIVTPAFTMSGEHRDNMDLFSRIVADGVPVVTMDRPLPDHRVSAVVFDQAACERRAVEWLGLRGVGRVGYLGLNRGYIGKSKLEAFEGACRNADIQYDPRRDCQSYQAPEDEVFVPEEFGAAAVSSLLESAPDIEALVCYSDAVATGAARYLVEAGVKHNIRYLLFNCNANNCKYPRELIGQMEVMALVRDCYQIGREAASMLLRHVFDGIPDKPVVKYLPPRLIGCEELA